MALPKSNTRIPDAFLPRFSDGPQRDCARNGTAFADPFHFSLSRNNAQAGRAAARPPRRLPALGRSAVVGRLNDGRSRICGCELNGLWDSVFSVFSARKYRQIKKTTPKEWSKQIGHILFYLALLSRRERRKALRVAVTSLHKSLNRLRSDPREVAVDWGMRAMTPLQIILSSTLFSV
jgi:hypothetical protein